MWEVVSGFDIKETTDEIVLGKGKAKYSVEGQDTVNKEFEVTTFPKKNKKMFIQINPAGNLYSASSRNAKHCLIYSVLLVDKTIDAVIPSGNVTEIITDNGSIKEIARSIIDDALAINISNTSGFTDAIKRQISSYMSSVNINNIHSEKHTIVQGFIDTVHNVKKVLIALVEDMGILDDSYIASVENNRITFVGTELDGKEIEIIYLSNTAEMTNNVDDYITQEVENQVQSSMGARIGVDTVQVINGKIKLEHTPTKILNVYVENKGELYVEDLDTISGNYLTLGSEYEDNILEIVYVW